MSTFYVSRSIYIKSINSLHDVGKCYIYHTSHHIHTPVFSEHAIHIVGSKYRYPNGFDTCLGLVQPNTRFFLHILQLRLPGDKGVSFKYCLCLEHIFSLCSFFFGCILSIISSIIYQNRLFFISFFYLRISKKKVEVNI